MDDLSYRVQTRGPIFELAQAPSFRPGFHHCLPFVLRLNHLLQVGPDLGLYIFLCRRISRGTVVAIIDAGGNGLAVVHTRRPRRR